MKPSNLIVEETGLLANPAAVACPAPAVSVVITLYNYAAYIRECLDSVRASVITAMPGGFEVVVVDDASTDNSAAVVESYMAACVMPVRLLKHPANRGLADSRNAGLHAARAPLVFILDADNRLRPDCLQAHYEAITSTDFAMVYAHVNRFDHATGASLGVMCNLEWDPRLFVTHPYVDAMAIFRKDILLRVGAYSTEYAIILPQGWEDYDLCLKLVQAGYHGKMIPRILSDYRVHPDSMVHETDRSQRALAVYFTRKFHALVHQYPDTRLLFNLPRQDVAIGGGVAPRFHKPELTFGQKLVRGILGSRICYSLAKRLAALYAWINP